MNEKDLLAQLNKLKNTKPENSWKENNRSLLLSQISGGEEIEKNKVTLFDLLFKKTEWLAQPVGIMVLILAAVFGSGVLSIKAARDTKPGDSLYIAKIISEKTHQAITFDEKEKTKLRIEFAGKRAEEMARVLEEDTSEKKAERVEKLANDFKKEISVARVNLEKMNAGKEGEPEKTETESGEEEQVFSADFGKTNNGLQVSEAGAVKEEVVKIDPKKILEEAGHLFSQEDYAGTLNKLEEANAVLEKTAGEIKVIEEGTATSTEPVVNESAASTTIENIDSKEATSTEEK